MAKDTKKLATPPTAQAIGPSTMVAVPLWINAAAAVYAGLVAKLWDTDKLIEGHMHEAEIPEEALRKAAEETKRSMQFFGEEFGLIKKR